jgi:hypothetical protein
MKTLAFAGVFVVEAGFFGKLNSLKNHCTTGLHFSWGNLYLFSTSCIWQSNQGRLYTFNFNIIPKFIGGWQRPSKWIYCKAQGRLLL